jgi:hypothetical protein
MSSLHCSAKVSVENYQVFTGEVDFQKLEGLCPDHTVFAAESVLALIRGFMIVWA